MLQSLEEILNGILGRLRESAGQEAMKALPWSNTPRIMADCGSKGSPLNISQMISCVGQQAVGGDRIQNGFVNRTLPHFEYHSLTPAAKGFVANSFYKMRNKDLSAFAFPIQKGNINILSFNESKSQENPSNEFPSKDNATQMSPCVDIIFIAED